MMETLREDLKITLTDQSKEFDYRTNMLATEITTLKEIVMKLQSYTLEVNQTLLEERNQFFNETENSIQIQSDEKLNDEDLEIIDHIENISMELQESIAEEAVAEEAVAEEAVAEEAVVEEAVAEEAVAEEANEQETIEEDAAEEDAADQEAIEEETVEPEEPVQEKKTRRKKKDKKSLSVDL